MVSRSLSLTICRGLMAFAFTGLLLTLPASADIVPGTVSNDEFDSTQPGMTILGSDTITSAVNVFSTTGGFENGHTLMRNGGTGSVSFIEYETGSIVRLGGIRLFAQHDGAANSFRRAMNRFRLLADTDLNGSYETVAIDQAINIDYSTQSGNAAAAANQLDLTIATASPVDSKRWRIEVTQGTNVQPFEGARVVEVDALGTFLTGWNGDPFDSTQGTTILSDDTIVDPINVFRTSGGFENGNTLMSNAGFIGGLSFINFRTGGFVSLNAVRLFAKNDNTVFDRRSINRFRLLADTNEDGTYETVAIDRFVNPNYASEPGNEANDAGYLDVTNAVIGGNVIARRWRFETYQGSNVQPFEGARIIELDAVGAFVPAADLSITRTGPTSVVSGQTVTYVSTVTNSGPTAVSTTVSTPAIPGLTFISNTGACTTPFPCSVGVLSAGGSAVINSTWLVPSGYVTPNPIVSSATVSSTTYDFDPSNNSLGNATRVSQDADVAVTVVPPTSIVPGTNAVFTVTVNNAGPSDSQTNLGMPTPSGLVFISNSGACSGTFPCTLSLVSGSSATVTTTFGVPSSYVTPDPVSVTATLSPATFDSVTANNAASANSPVSPSADLSITKSGPATFTPGQPLTYSIVVVNTGPSDAKNVSVSDPTPPGLVFVSTSGDCTSSFPCSLGTLPNGATRSITVSFIVPSSYSSPDPIVNTSTVSSTAGDPNSGNNSGSVSSFGSPVSDLQVTMSGPASASAGNPLVYQITITNNGPSDASNIVVTDPTPEGLVFLSNQENCISGFPCTISSLVAGATINITASFRVAGNTSQPLVNTVTVSASNSDSTLANNTVSVLTTSCPGPITEMFPTEGSTAVPQSGQLRWNGTNADNYQVYLGLAGSGCTNLIGTVSNGPFSYQDLAVRTDYEWRIVALRNGCAPVSSPCLQFKSGPLCRTASAVPTFPPQGGKNFISPVTFKWTGAPEASSYVLWISIGGAAFVRIGSTSGTSMTTEVSPGSIAWYIETIYSADCPSVESGRSTFTATGSCVTEGATLVGPPDGSTQQSPVRFEWTPVGSAIGYRVWVSVDGKFPIIVAAASASETHAIARVGSGALDWFVESLFDRCPPALSEHRKFTVQPLSTCGTHIAPDLVSPKNDVTTTSPVLFQWSAVPQAIGYTLWLSVDGDSPAVVASTATETSASREVAPGLVSWFVEPLFDQCPTTRSQTGSFTVKKTVDCEHEKSILTAPVPNASLPFTIATFTWTPVTEAIEYRLWLRADGGEKVLFGTTTTETTLKGIVPPGRIEWWIESLFNRCPLTESNHAFFDSPRPASCPPQAPATISPAFADVITNERVNFRWTSVGALAYNVWLVPDDGFKTFLGTTDKTSLETEITHGDFGWFVEAIFSGCPSNESPRIRFSFPSPANCDDRRPLLISPPDGATGLSAPIHFIWTPIKTAKAYSVTYQVGDRAPVRLAASPQTTEIVIPLPGGLVRWNVTALFNDCPATQSTSSTLTVLADAPPCDIPDAPTASVIGQVTSGEPYRVFWKPVAGATIYEILETTVFSAGQPDFSGITPTVVAGVFADYVRNLGAGEPSRKFYYRVRGISDCHQQRGPYSDVAETEVIAQAPSTQAGSQSSVSRKLTLCADSEGTIFECSGVTKRQNANADPINFSLSLSAPWISVSPATGTIPAGGSTTLNVMSDPAKLPTGTSTGSISIIPSTGAPATFTNTLSLASPVSPTPNTAPTPYSLIIPVVGHAVSGSTTFKSDVRITNASARVIKYELAFTPSNNDGTQVGQQATMEIEPGRTTAIDDIVKSWYSSASANVIGVLQVRPLNPPAGASNLRSSTLVSSRTFSNTPAGTFGQYVPAIPFSSFIGGNERTGILSLQQVAQSNTFRTNFGFIEALGKPVSLRISFFNSNGTRLGQSDIELRAGEHKQLNSLMSTLGITSSDVRAEVAVISGEGRATAYASVVDNSSNDPYLVSPVDLTRIGASKFVVPGVADLNSGNGRWRSDVRIFNAQTTPAKMTVTFYPQNEPAQFKTVDMAVGPGEMRVLDDILATLFGETNTGGAVHVTTTDSARLVVSARTYNQLQDGTFGQFVPAVTPAEAVGAGDAPLQLLQLEQSKRMRSNVGIAEMSGKPVRVEISAIVAEALSATKMIIDLKANEFRQMSSVLTQLGIQETFNGRISIHVISGEGRVTAYASVIDNSTGDPTYVPAQ